MEGEWRHETALSKRHLPYSAMPAPDFRQTSDNWSKGSVGSWYGVKVSSFETVCLLQLPSNGLGGPLPDCLSNLVMLEVLDLHGNNLQGPLPEVHQMLHLRILDLSHNKVEPASTSLRLLIPDVVLMGDS